MLLDHSDHRLGSPGLLLLIGSPVAVEFFPIRVGGDEFHLDHTLARRGHRPVKAIGLHLQALIDVIGDLDRLIEQQHQGRRFIGEVPGHPEKNVHRPVGLIRRLRTVLPDAFINVAPIEHAHDRLAPVGVGDDDIGPVLAAVLQSDANGPAVLRQNLGHLLPVVHFPAQFPVAPLDRPGEGGCAADRPGNVALIAIGMFGQMQEQGDVRVRILEQREGPL